MNPKKPRFLGMLWMIACLLLVNGCDSVEVTNEAPAFNPGPGIEIPAPDFFARASFSFEVPVAGKARLRLKAHNGRIEIKCLADATTVTVTGERRVGSDRMQDAEAHLDDLEVQVEDLDDEVYVHTVQPEKNNKGRQYAVDYTITIPQDLAVVVHQINGLVRVDDLRASAAVTLVNGTVEGAIILPLNGQIDLSTVNGDIDLTIPTATSAAFSASVGIGTVSLSNLNLKGGTNAPRSKSGTLGDGEGMIVLRTSIGDITVTGQP